MLIHRLTATVNDPTLPLFSSLVDPILSGVGLGGVLLADFGLAPSWSSAVADGAVVNNLADVSKPGSLSVRGAGAAVAGGGLDTAACTLVGNYLLAPSTVVAGITGGNQYYLILAYIKLPTTAEWNTAGSIWPMLQIADDGEIYTTGQQMIAFAQGTGTSISIRRQTGAGAAETSALAATSHQGAVAQIAYWRNASGYRAQVRTVAGGTTQVSGVIGTRSAENYTASRLQFGGGFGPWNGGNPGVALNANGLGATNTRSYRVWVENLELSGRDPATVVAADFDRVISRLT